MKKNNLVAFKGNNPSANKHPLNNLIMGNMPGLPSIIQNSMPPELPRASYKQGSIDLFFGNIKRGQLLKAVTAEAEMAEETRKAVHSKLEMIHEMITFSARTQNTFQEYEHQQIMRRVAVEQSALTTTHMELVNENQKIQNENLQLQNDHLKVQTYKLQAEATQAGWEANISELDYKMRLKQFEKMMGEMQND